MALKGIRVIEMAGLAPAPFCGLILSDFGADVIRIDKPNSAIGSLDRLARGKRSILVDLKSEKGIDIVRRICKNADVLIEPYRPGVMERLGLGPKLLMEENPKLIYARLTGFGQQGPYKDMAGHDINYIAVAGVLSMLGRKHENPLAPINLLADFAGGGLMCSLGICFALFERTKSGKGQLIDSNMVGGSAYVSTWLWRSQDLMIWGKSKGENALDSGSYFYETYKTQDGKYMAVGALEPQFFDELRQILGLSDDELGQFDDTDACKSKLSSIFAQKTQAEWCDLFDGTSACVTPVLDRNEAHHHPHNKACNNFIEGAFGPEPAPAPKLQRTPAVPKITEPLPGSNTLEILLENGFSKEEITNLLQNEVVFENEAQPKSKL